MDRHVWIDGEVRSRGAAVVPALSSGCQFGEGVFETLRIEEGLALWVPAHARRLASAIDAFGLGRAIAARELREIFRELARVEGANRAVGRLTVLAARVRVPGGKHDSTDDRHIIAHLRPVPARLDPIDVIFACTRRDPRDIRFAHKTTSAIDRAHAAAEAERRGANDVISVNHDGTIGEALWSNLFFVDGKELVTPTLRCGILPGVQRARVLQLARDLGLDAVERPVHREEVASFGACFLTNVARGLVRVGRLEGRDLHGASTEIVSRLEQAIDEDRSSSRSRYGSTA